MIQFPIVMGIGCLQLIALILELAHGRPWGALFWLGCIVANVGILGGMTR